MRKSILITLCASVLLPAAASAQSNVEGRVGKLESEMRAVQRKVFPGGSGMLQPEISAPQPGPGIAPGAPSSSAVVDLSARVTSLEQQIASLTGQIEQNQNRVRQVEDAFDAYRRTNDGRLKMLESNGAPPPITRSNEPAASTPVGPNRTTPRPTTRPETTAAPTPAAAGSPRAKLVEAVERPSTGDAPEDAYLYGYRLWAANLYPEAEAQLKKVVADYPKHKRASYAQNLLGRAYLDDGKPSLASMAFYDNYKKMPDGERAPDSLLYLGQALQTLKKPADACKVYDELNDVYGAKLSPAMKADVAKGRASAKCG